MRSCLDKKSSAKTTGAAQGFTLIEVILVIALMGVIFILVVPNFNILPSTEATTKINALAGDIRSAYDMAVLHRKPFRLAFEFKTSQYWLETTDRLDFQFGDNPLQHDLSAQEIKEQAAQFEEDFTDYVALAGKDVEDPESEHTIKPTSPLLAARSSLKPVTWKAVEDSEWSKRSLGPSFLVRGMQAEHHKSLQTYEDLQTDGYTYLYFFPQGYVERAVIYIAPADEADKSKWDQLTYTVTTRSYEGMADVETGYKEVDITRDQQTR